MPLQQVCEFTLSVLFCNTETLKAQRMICIFLGYDLATEEGFEKMMRDFEAIIGLSYLKALHLNDSKGKHEQFAINFDLC